MPRHLKKYTSTILNIINWIFCPVDWWLMMENTVRNLKLCLEMVGLLWYRPNSKRYFRSPDCPKKQYIPMRMIVRVGQVVWRECLSVKIEMLFVGMGLMGMIRSFLIRTVSIILKIDMWLTCFKIKVMMCILLIVTVVRQKLPVWKGWCTILLQEVDYGFFLSVLLETVL